MSTGLIISLKYVVYAKPEQVFKALTKPEIIEAWSHEPGELNPYEGGNFSWFNNWVMGRVLSADKNESLAFTWKPTEWGNKTKESIVNIQLNKHPAGTEIVLSHSEFPTKEEMKNHKNGWIDFVFDPLNDYFSLVMEKK